MMEKQLSNELCWDWWHWLHWPLQCGNLNRIWLANWRYLSHRDMPRGQSSLSLCRHVLLGRPWAVRSRPDDVLTRRQRSLFAAVTSPTRATWATWATRRQKCFIAVKTVGHMRLMARWLVSTASYAAFYWARELVFVRNKLIMFTTSRELPHYVVFSWIMMERKVGVVLKSIVFMCIFIYFYESCLTIVRLKNETNVSFNLIKKTLTSICTVCKTLHVGAAIFISQLVEVHNSPPVHDWWLRDLGF